jgi:fengycin family lipopeptide synthetase D
MKNNPEGHLTFIEFLQRVRENALAAYENQDYQFEEVVDKLSYKRELNRNPIFDIMFNVQNTEIPEIKIRDITLTPCRIDIGAVKLDVKINIEEYGDKLCCTLDYVTSLFKPETMDTFIDNFKKVIQQVTADPMVKISTVQLVSEDVKKELVNNFNEELEYKF